MALKQSLQRTHYSDQCSISHPLASLTTLHDVPAITSLCALCMQAIQDARSHGLKFEWEKLYGDSAHPAPAPAPAAQSCSPHGDEASMDQQGQSSAGSFPVDLIILDSESEADGDLIDLTTDSEA